MIFLTETVPRVALDTGNVRADFTLSISLLFVLEFGTFSVQTDERDAVRVRFVVGDTSLFFDSRSSSTVYCDGLPRHLCRRAGC